MYNEQFIDEHLKNNEPINSKFIDENITHEEFVRGIKNGKLKIIFTLKDLNVYSLLPRTERKYLAVIIGITSLIPPVLVVLLAIIYAKWWFLLGLPIWWIASVVSQFNSTPKLSADLMISILSNKPLGILMLFVIGSSITKGFHLNDYFTFFPLIYLLSHFLTEVEKYFTKKYFINLLIEDSYIFEDNKQKFKLFKTKKNRV